MADQPTTNPNQAPPAAALPAVPATWPGAFGLYKYSKQAVLLNLGTLIGLWLISVVAGIFLGDKLGIVGRVLAFVVSAYVSAGCAYAFLAGVRGQKLAFGDALKQAWEVLLPIVILTILVTVSLIVSFVLLIIPFFIVLPR